MKPEERPGLWGKGRKQMGNISSEYATFSLHTTDLHLWIFWMFSYAYIWILRDSCEFFFPLLLQGQSPNELYRCGKENDPQSSPNEHMLYFIIHRRCSTLPIKTGVPSCKGIQGNLVMRALHACPDTSSLF